MSRERSASSQRNDERILDAALTEIAIAGVDRLGMGAVAQRAGLTTGALYSRYEGAGELAAAVWATRVRDRHRALLDLAMKALVDGDRAVVLDDLLEELRLPSPETLVAIEMLVTARRVDELEEVVLPDVKDWVTDWAAASRANAARRRAQVLFLLGTLWGIVLHVIPAGRRLGWKPVLTDLGRSFERRYETPSHRLVAERVQAVRAQSDDPIQRALIDAVAAIVARVGFERATVSRIARRAGFTAGAIYARYQTKDELLEHAVDSLLGRRLAEDVSVNSYMFTSKELGADVARIFGGYLSAPRREWRRFRVEAQLAARRHAPVAATLDRVQESAIRAYLEALGARTEEERRALDLLGRAAQLVPLGLALVDLVVADVPRTDWRAVTVPLFSSGPA